MPWTADDVPDQTGRTAIVTGGNTGLGFETALVLASRGAHVVLAVRSLERGNEAATKLRSLDERALVSVQELDLGSLESVRRAADAMLETLPAIDLLINNAGIMTPPRSLTSDGFESQFGTNHLGHFALTGLLLERITETAGSRVVSVSSNGHRWIDGIRFEDPQWAMRYNRIQAYGQAKLANLMFIYELQRRLVGSGTIATAAHPGSSNTDLARHMPALVRWSVPLFAPLTTQPPQRAALPTLRAATDSGVLGGQYIGPDGLGQLKGNPIVRTSSAVSYDLDQQESLWLMSESLTGIHYPALARR